MAERKIHPKQMLLLIDPAGGTDYDTVVCLTSIDLGITNNEIDADSFCGPDKIPGTQEYNGSFEGITLLDPDTGKVSVDTLFTLAKDRTVFSFKVAKAVPASGDINYTASAFLSELSQTFSNDSAAGFTGTLGISGSITQTVTP